jgi:hypothetical protein
MAEVRVDNRFSQPIQTLIQAQRIDQVTVPSPESLDPVVAFLVDFENYGAGIGRFEALDERHPGNMWAIIDGVGYESAARFIEEHDLAEQRMLGQDSPLDLLALLLRIAWQMGYFMFQFRRYDRIPIPRAPVDPIAIMDRTVDVAAGAGIGPEIEVFLQKAVTLRTEPEAIRRTCFTPFAGDEVERLLTPLMEEWAQALRAAYGLGLLVARIETDLTETH